MERSNLKDKDVFKKAGRGMVKTNVSWIGKIDWELRKFQGALFRKHCADK